MNLALTPPFGSLVDSTPVATHRYLIGRAVVIGGSMGGLLAARALANHADQVFVLDRDTFPEDNYPRRGVPQGAHVHALLARGCEALERQFPGILQQFVAAGASVGDAMADAAWYQQGGLHASGTIGVPAIVASRPLIERVVRERVAALPNVTIRQQVAVRNLLWSDDGSRVTGVRYCGQVDDLQETRLVADLVIDASGRGSQLPAWLEEAGIDLPDEQSMEIGIRYTSRRFRRQAHDLVGKVVTIISNSRGNPRGGLAFAIENDAWLITLTGRTGIVPPSDLDGFRRFAATLDAPVIAQFLADAEPIGEATTYAMPRSQRRFQPGPCNLPPGIIPFADAICGFNPLFGQGMSVAALEADALDTTLAAGMDDLAQRFLTQVGPIVDGAWKLAAGNDLRFVPGQQRLPFQLRFLHWYLDQLHVAARHDTTVSAAFCQVVHMLKPPQSLMQPDIARRVLVHRALAPLRFGAHTVPYDNALTSGQRANLHGD